MIFFIACYSFEERSASNYYSNFSEKIALNMSGVNNHLDECGCS